MKATGPTRNANASAALTARNVPSIAINKPGTAQYLAVGAISVYVVLLALVFATGERAELLPSERLAAGLSGMILSTAFVIRILEQMVRPAPSTGVGTVMIVVHLISCATNLMLTVGPMPMLIDPFTNCRVHLVRWCEWTVLAFTMSFVVEAIDSYDIKRPIAFGLTMGGSTVCGLILPYTTGPISWIIVMTISFVLYFDLFRRVYIKIKNKVAMPAGWPKGGTPQEREAYRRWISARRLVVSCAVMWTAFVADYFGAWIADVTDPCQRDDPSCEHVPMAWPFILDCFVDVAAKMVRARPRDQPPAPARVGRALAHAVLRAPLARYPHPRAAAAGSATRSCWARRTRACPSSSRTTFPTGLSRRCRSCGRTRPTSSSSRRAPSRWAWSRRRRPSRCTT
jgi:hypothetical protein